MLFFFARALRLGRLKACYIFRNVLCRLHILCAHRSVAVGVAERPLAGPAHNSTAIANCDCGFVCTFPASDEVGLSVLRSSSPQYPVPRPAQDSARVIGKRQAVRLGVPCRRRVCRRGTAYVLLKYAHISLSIWRQFRLPLHAPRPTHNYNWAQLLGWHSFIVPYGMFCGPHNH